MGVASDRIWHRWMEATDGVFNRYVDSQEENPFAYNEQASVGFLVAGAERAGLICLAEYCADKGDENNTKLRHRCDLWLRDEASDREWSFEFKYVWATRIADIEKSVGRARRGAMTLRTNDGTRCFALVAVFDELESRKEADVLIEEIKKTYDQSLFVRFFDRRRDAVALSAIFIGEYDSDPSEGL